MQESAKMVTGVIELNTDQLSCVIHRLSEIRVVDIKDDEVIPLKTALAEMKKTFKEIMDL